MTDETPSATPADATRTQLSRPPARFFFEIGYYACWAEAVARSAGTPPFALSDQLLDRAWSIAGEAHDDRAEFDRYLVSANSADDRLASALPSPGGVDEVAARMAAADGLDWNEQCAFEASEDADCCDSGTCVAAYYEDHDPEVARRWYRRHAEAALGIGRVR